MSLVVIYFICPCFQFLAIFVHTPELRGLNLWMNGPRVHWGRGLQLTLQLFIIFNRGEIFYGDLLETVEEEIRGNWPVGGQIEHWGHVWVGYVGILLLFVLTSWMAAEQILQIRQERAFKAKLQKTDCKFADFRPEDRRKYQGERYRSQFHI